MKDRYNVTQNVVGGLKIGLRNLGEAAAIAFIMGMVIAYGTTALPTVSRGILTLFFCIIPAGLAVIGLYNMTLFQFLSVQIKRIRGMEYIFRLPTEEGFETDEQREKRERIEMQMYKKKEADYYKKAAKTKMKAERKRERNSRR